MTTVVYDKRTKTIGADSKNTDSSGQVFLCNKIERLKNGKFFLGSGHNLTISLVRGWAEVDFDPELRPDFEMLFGEQAEDYGMSCLVISADGEEVTLIDDEMTPMVIEDEIVATGSGGSVARGALAAGATVEEAVAIAIRYDSNSGGPVRAHRIETTH